MTDTRFRELFTEYESHPLVAFFISQLNNKGGRTGISEVWRDFMRKTDDATDMSILRVQFANWGLINKIDTTLRGEQLLRAVESIHLKPYFSSAQTVVDRHPTTSFPEALERILTVEGVLPSLTTESAEDMGGAGITMDLTYVETGTVTYTATRRIPRCLLVIPRTFVVDHFGPEVSDANIIARFKDGMNTFFGGTNPNYVASNEEAGIALNHMREVLWQELMSEMEFNQPFKLSKGFVINGILNDEPPIQIQLSQPKPRSLHKYADTAAELVKRQYQLAPHRRRSGGGREVECWYPAYTQKTKGKLSTRGMRPANAKIYSDPIDFTQLDAYGPTLVSFLRQVYTMQCGKLQYEHARAEAMALIKTAPTKEKMPAPHPIKKKVLVTVTEAPAPIALEE
jgi:hypothetical protein